MGFRFLQGHSNIQLRGSLYGAKLSALRAHGLVDLSGICHGAVIILGYCFLLNIHFALFSCELYVVATGTACLPISCVHDIRRTLPEQQHLGRIFH